MFWAYFGSAVGVVLLLIVIFDVTQQTHTILHNFLIIKHDAFPPMIDAEHSIENERSLDPFALPASKIIGLPRGRRHAFRPASVINISGMSFGALSGRAVEALNRGALLAGCMQSTGEAASRLTTAAAATSSSRSEPATTAAATSAAASASIIWNRRSPTRR